MMQQDNWFLHIRCRVPAAPAPAGTLSGQVGRAALNLQRKIQLQAAA
jgi:hypothetical protein